MKTAKRMSSLTVQRAGPGMHHDGDGLYLRVSKSGAKSWVFRFMLNGRACEMGLGRERAVGLAAARAAATEARSLCHQGKNPLDARRARKNQIANDISPKADETALYRHFDAEGRLLYVGISLRAFQRLCQHQTDSKWWLKIARVTIEQFGTRRGAEEAELAAIKVELPIYNNRHKPRVESLGSPQPKNSPPNPMSRPTR